MLMAITPMSTDTTTMVTHGDGAPFRRTDIHGYLAARYQPNERLEPSDLDALLRHR